MEKSRPIAQLSGPTHLTRWRSPGLLRSSLDLPTSRDGEVQAYCATLWTYPPRAMEKSRPIAQLSADTRYTVSRGTCTQQKHHARVQSPPQASPGLRIAGNRSTHANMGWLSKPNAWLLSASHTHVAAISKTHTYTHNISQQVTLTHSIIQQVTHSDKVEKSQEKVMSRTKCQGQALDVFLLHPQH